MKYSPICARQLYVWVLAVFLVNLVALLTTRAHLSFQDLDTILMSASVFGLWYFALRRAIQDETTTSFLIVYTCRALEVLFFLKLAWINLRIFNHLSMMAPFPYADNLLLSWDQAINAPWQAYFEVMHENPLLIDVLSLSYTSLTPLSILTLLLLCFWRDGQRARFFVNTFFVTAMICLIVGSAFPAKAAVLTLIEDLSVYGNFPSAPGVYHYPYMETLRDSTVSPTLHVMALPGLVTFPSFHTASGILLMIAFWRTWAFMPAMIYAVTMIASTPIFGGHYFIDLIAGASVALAVCLAFAVRPNFTGLFLAQRPQTFSAMHPIAA